MSPSFFRPVQNGMGRWNTNNTGLQRKQNKSLALWDIMTFYNNFKLLGVLQQQALSYLKEMIFIQMKI